jgi:hypothetical protein|tara:strand:+ start:168 stop:341 length:174 start_codon:yes stop_codon:yes gene_type:complete
MKEIITEIWAIVIALLLIIDFFIIAFLFTVILVVLLSPLVILVGVPIMIDTIWKKKY